MRFLKPKTIIGIDEEFHRYKVIVETRVLFEETVVIMKKSLKHESVSVYALMWIMGMSGGKGGDEMYPVLCREDRKKHSLCLSQLWINVQHKCRQEKLVQEENLLDDGSNKSENYFGVLVFQTLIKLLMMLCTNWKSGTADEMTGRRWRRHDNPIEHQGYIQWKRNFMCKKRYRENVLHQIILFQLIHAFPIILCTPGSSLIYWNCLLINFLPTWFFGTLAGIVYLYLPALVILARNYLIN